MIRVVQEVNAGFLADVDELSGNNARRRNAARWEEFVPAAAAKDKKTVTTARAARRNFVFFDIQRETSHGYFVALPDPSSRRSDLMILLIFWRLLLCHEQLGSSVFQIAGVVIDETELLVELWQGNSQFPQISIACFS